jgi:large subunit ribosomal protein L24
MALAKIRKGDRVIVLTGRDKGKKGEVLRVDPKDGRAVVQGVNVVRRHTKETAQTQGGIIAREAPIHLSNIAVEDPRDGKPTKVGVKVMQDGSRVRVAKRSGEVIPTPKGN